MYQDRAALLASCQLPLIVALAGKNNVISCAYTFMTYSLLLSSNANAYGPAGLTGVGHEKVCL